MYDEEMGIGDKVHCILRDRYDSWRESDASEFACSVIRNGYIPEFSSDSGCYSESFSAHAQWGMEAVVKLVKAKIVRKVRKEDLTSINPLLVAVNIRVQIKSTREAPQIIDNPTSRPFQKMWC